MRIYVDDFYERCEDSVDVLVQNLLWWKRWFKERRLKWYSERVSKKIQEIIEDVVTDITEGISECSEEPPTQDEVNNFRKFVKREIFVFSRDFYAIKKHKDSSTAYITRIQNLAMKILQFALSLEKIKQQKVLEMFIKNNLEFKKGWFLTKDKVYNAYVRLSTEQQVSPVPKNIFGKAVFAKIPNVETTRRRIKGKATYGWQNLSFKK